MQDAASLVENSISVPLRLAIAIVPSANDGPT